MNCALFLTGIKSLIVCLAMMPFFVQAQSLQPLRSSDEISSPRSQKERLDQGLRDQDSRSSQGREPLRKDDDRDWIQNSKKISSQQMRFLLKAPPKEISIIKLDAGGGVADGGGGNTSAKTGELLDRQIFAGATRLKTEELQTIFLSQYESKLAQIETDLPGFTDWISFGFRKSWYLDSETKPFDTTKCLKQLCQTTTAVFLKQDTYQEATRPEQTRWILRALLAAQVQRSDSEAVGRNPYRLAEMILVQMTKPKISTKAISQILSSYQILDSAEIAESRRGHWVELLDAQLKKADATWQNTIRNCADLPFDLTRTIQKAQSEYRQIAKLCLQIVNPQVDGGACDRRAIQDMMDLLNSTQCKGSSVLSD